MTSNKTPALSRQPAFRSRVLAAVLLVLVGYSSIAVAAHNHNNVTLLSGSDIACASITQTDQDGTSSKTPMNGGVCTVCQLHQNLLAALTNHVLETAPTEAQLSHKPYSPVFNPLEIGISKHGRAPPVTF